MTLLQGRRILITRAEDDSRLWASRLEELGATVIVFPCIECVLEEDPQLAQELKDALSSAQWLVFCSRRAVQAVAGLLEGAAFAVPDHVQIAVVGPATAAAARDLLGRTDLEARGGTGAALCNELEAFLSTDDRVVIALTSLSDHSIEERLSEAGAKVQRLNVYRSGPVAAQESRTTISTASVDLALLASPSAVTGLLNRATVATTLPVLTIGPTTTAAARLAGLNVLAEAKGRGLDAMLKALEETI
jgi:uroporphyrinogen-III synthase